MMPIRYESGIPDDDHDPVTAEPPRDDFLATLTDMLIMLTYSFAAWTAAAYVAVMVYFEWVNPTVNYVAPLLAMSVFGMVGLAGGGTIAALLGRLLPETDRSMRLSLVAVFAAAHGLLWSASIREDVWYLLAWAGLILTVYGPALMLNTPMNARARYVYVQLAPEYASPFSERVGRVGLMLLVAWAFMALSCLFLILAPWWLLLRIYEAVIYAGSLYYPDARTAGLVAVCYGLYGAVYSVALYWLVKNRDAEAA
jgi:hypothetical protein